MRCEPFLLRQVALVRPRVILAVGGVAAQNLLKSQETVGRMRGRSFSSRYSRSGQLPSCLSAALAGSKAKAWQDLQRLVGILKA